jgi:hypothetical protein
MTYHAPTTLRRTVDFSLLCIESRMNRRTGRKFRDKQDALSTDACKE